MTLVPVTVRAVPLGATCRVWETRGGGCVVFKAAVLRMGFRVTRPSLSPLEITKSNRAW